MEHTDLLAEYHDTFNGTSVVLMNEISPKYFHMLHDPQQYLAFTKDRLFIQNTVFYFNDISILKEIFNRKLRSFQEAGFVEFWVKKYTESMRMKRNRRNPTKLELNSILGLFQICIVMYLVSCIVFILEMVVAKIRYIQPILDYLTY